MTDYQPLPLERWWNAGTELLGAHERPPLGACQMRGIPFAIGADPRRCFVAFGDGFQREPLAIPIGRSVRTVTFAHRLLDSRVAEGGAPGDTAAFYELRLAGGVERRPIRERFEIGYQSARPWSWPSFATRSPAVALPAGAIGLPPRFEGDLRSVGRRQLEIGAASATAYFLWAWRLGRSERLDEIVVVPTGRTLLLAAITLGSLDEHPLVPGAARPVRIDLLDAAAADRAFDLEVDIDRGAATFPYPLPRARAEDFLGSDLKGFGQVVEGPPADAGRIPSPIERRHSSPAYVQIAAVPSATLRIGHAGGTLGQVAWRDLEAGRPVERDRVRVQLIDPGRNWIRTTVVDDATGRPIPCRVHFRSPEGVPYQPHGHHAHINGELDTWNVDVGGDVRLGEVTYAYIDGACEGWLPRGDVIVDVARGFEYEPLRTTIHVAPGQRELTLRLRRWSDLNSRGWYSGDTHVHFLSTAGAHLEARAEDLNVVNLLTSQWGSLFTNGEDFMGAANVSQDGRTIVYASQENRQHFLGHLGLLGLKTPIMPWCSDGPAEAEMGGTLETSLAHWADECRTQGGTVVLAHMPMPNGEPASLIATGRVDAVETIAHDPYVHSEYYRYLNCGYRLPFVGGTDKMSNEVPVGLYRTYVRIPDGEFEYESWCRNLRAGRTFVSSGPLLSLTVEGREIGDTLELPSGGGTVEVHATAESILPLERLEVVMAGKVVAATTERSGRRLEFRARVPITGNTWLAARAGAADYDHPRRHADWPGRGIMAHTSPIYVACGREWSMYDHDTARYMRTLVDLSLTYLREAQVRWPPGTVTHRHGEADHQAFLERPFHEARAAIERRIEMKEESRR